VKICTKQLASAPVGHLLSHWGLIFAKEYIQMIRGCGFGCILFSCKQECGTGVYANILFIKAHGIYSPAGGGRGRRTNRKKVRLWQK